MHRVVTERAILDSNDELAAKNRAFFQEMGIFVVNLMSAPGAGKTSVLEQTIKRLAGRWRIGVIEGDLMTSLDADRISATGVPALQITTGNVCHLDSLMVERALQSFDTSGFELLVIENVGNLVCPAEFNLGEDLRVMVYSVVEGADKPRKYPLMFHEAEAVLLNKVDLIPYSGVSLDELKSNIREVNPQAPIFPLSCRNEAGVDEWTEWLTDRVRPKVRGQ
ncbi:MAG: hydrogenase accessory protein HypB [Acidobacteria bacterium]|nr:hydrogenase accessory protein HypB [Acidobacteriota bacterium]